MGKIYYYADKDNQQHGPVSAEELIEHGVTNDSMVWNEGMSDWQTAGSIPELSAILQSQNNLSKLEKLDEKMSKNQIFTFLNPYMEYLVKGKFFSIVYILLAVANLILPFVVLFQVIDSGFFKYAESNQISAFILLWIVIVFTCWIGFLLWWNRRKKVKSIGTSEFIAIPIFSHIIQTFGEWMGTQIGIIGAAGGLLTSIFLGNDTTILMVLGMEFMQRLGILAIIVAPIIGLIITILFRILAELLHMFAAIANNTKEIATNIKNN